MSIKIDYDNPFAPYPDWFGMIYGESLERMNNGYLRARCLHNIEAYKKDWKSLELRTCLNCKRYYYTKKSNQKACPFCSAPKDYDANKVLEDLLK